MRALPENTIQLWRPRVDAELGLLALGGSGDLHQCLDAAGVDEVQLRGIDGERTRRQDRVNRSVDQLLPIAQVEVAADVQSGWATRSRGRGGACNRQRRSEVSVTPPTAPFLLALTRTVHTRPDSSRAREHDLSWPSACSRTRWATRAVEAVREHSSSASVAPVFQPIPRTRAFNPGVARIWVRSFTPVAGIARRALRPTRRARRIRLRGCCRSCRSDEGCGAPGQRGAGVRRW